MRATLTFVPSTLGRSAVAATRRRGVSTCRTLFKPRSMLPRTLRAELGVSFCVVVPSVLKISKRSTQLKAKIIIDLILCPLHKCSEIKYFLRFYPNDEAHTFFRNFEICLRNLAASHPKSGYLLLIATDVRSS